MGDFGFGQTIRKLPKNYEKVLFYETYFEERNINQKPLISFHDKIAMKLGPKIWVSLVFRKVYKNSPKIKEK